MMRTHTSSGSSSPVVCTFNTTDAIRLSLRVRELELPSSIMPISCKEAISCPRGYARRTVVGPGMADLVPCAHLWLQLLCNVQLLGCTMDRRRVLLLRTTNTPKRWPKNHTSPHIASLDERVVVNVSRPCAIHTRPRRNWQTRRRRRRRRRRLVITQRTMPGLDSREGHKLQRTMQR